MCDLVPFSDTDSIYQIPPTSGVLAGAVASALAQKAEDTQGLSNPFSPQTFEAQVGKSPRSREVSAPSRNSPRTASSTNTILGPHIAATNRFAKNSVEDLQSQFPAVVNMMRVGAQRAGAQRPKKRHLVRWSGMFLVLEVSLLDSILESNF